MNPGPPAPKAENIKTTFPVRTIVWKHTAQVVIARDIIVDNLETLVRRKGLIAPTHIVSRGTGIVKGY